MQQFHFKIKGSVPTPYELTVLLEAEKIHISCTCKAGSIGQFCKHKLSILTGETSTISEGCLNELQLLNDTIASFEATQTINAIKSMENEIDQMKKRVIDMKKKLARITE